MELSDRLSKELIRHIPLQDTIVVPEETPILEVIRQMQQAHRGCALIAKEGHLHGLVTERDLLKKYISTDMSGDTLITEVMSTNLATLSPDDTLEKAIQVMTAGGYRHVPLVDSEGQILGMIGARNIVTFISEQYPVEVFNVPPRPDQQMGTPEGA